MRCLTRRTLGVTIGLVLGWYVAGSFQESTALWTSTSYAEDTSAKITTDRGKTADDDPHKAIFEHSFADGSGDSTNDVLNYHGTTGHHTQDSQPGHHNDLGVQAAEMLMPTSRQQVCWYRPVVITAGGLFIAAVVLGMPALAMRGPEPADPADDHTHDAHH